MALPIPNPWEPGGMNFPSMDQMPGAGLVNELNAFLAQPAGRAGLLQAGLSMSQPRRWGEDTFGAITRSIGAGGEAIGRQQEMDRKEQDIENKSMLAAARSDAAGSRLSAAGAGLDVKRQQLELNREREARIETTTLLNRQVQARLGYDKYRDKVEKEKLLNPGATVLSYPDWLEASGISVLLQPKSGVPTTGDAGGMMPNSDVPRDHSQREIGKVYTVKGKSYKWNGTTMDPQ